MNNRTLANNWAFREVGSSSWLPAEVPGCVHTDLARHALIPAPFYGTNEKDAQWIDKKDWEYETSFDVPESILRETNVELWFDGLDTYADVTLNGQSVLSADNMFRAWKVDAKRLLKTSGNRLHIRFRSPIKEDLPKLERLGYPLPSTNDQSEVGELGDKKVSVFARKAPYHYGWDWGPRFVTSGIWKKVRLEAWSGVRIRDIYIRQNSVRAESARLTAVVEVESDGEWDGTLRLATGNLNWEEAVRLKPGSQTIDMNIEIASPRLWWSRGLGDQNLYKFTAAFMEQGEETPCEMKSVKTGLRSIKLIREKDEHGTSFYFRLNGVAVFAKGANHIPNDSFLTEVTIERYRHEIVSAVESNMNMLRVWGGGIYENDEFYELCDEYGILVWQDFMFACAMYPGDEAFLDNVRNEAEQQIKRLRNHPSIALWCGNNEIDSAWAHYDEDYGWGWKNQYTTEQRNSIWNDYEAIFHRLLPSKIEKLHSEVDYWPSSPLCSLSGDARQHARIGATGGDIHYWGVWHNVEPFENYNRSIGRFMSEYGFQSFPEHKTVRTYAEESDMRLDSEVMLRHQKNGQGNSLIKQYMDIYLPEPKDFPSFLYLSQVLQAEAMKTAIEAHRRRKFMCMGSLYWQMNDCWPVASWSSMDYYGRWKAIQYYARRSFSDVMISLDGTSGERIDIHVVSDIQASIEGTLELKLFDFSGRLLDSWSEEVAVDENSEKMAISLDNQRLTEGRDPHSLVLVANLIGNGKVLDSKQHYFVSSKEIALRQPELTVTRSPEGDPCAVRLETNELAKQVWITTGDEGTFTDNYFDLIPGIPVTVRFLTRETKDGRFVPGIPGELEVRSMYDFIK
ncbi:glycoside hydrolase family 2 protein [Cohnella endophytica]|uniref:Beta-mannosidase n=1 Tax=Cohnella endophytica TaxID=2419778 RepID=A0A494XK10_9BACL|nr:glycoside hydrolase family 2 protein [Cohnella endophytica]RKP50062.1 glycoside hydrolase family 2 protein [Cohnella endophytica]